MRKRINLVLLNRNLRLEDNLVINSALNDDLPVLLVYIFDNKDFLNQRQKCFVYDLLKGINDQLKVHNSSIFVEIGNSIDTISSLIIKFEVRNIYTNEDFEPQNILFLKQLNHICTVESIGFHTVKDHIIFSPGEILKNDGTPYVVFTAYKKRWLDKYERVSENNLSRKAVNFFTCNFEFPKVNDIVDPGLCKSVKPFYLDVLFNYEYNRDFPFLEGTSNLGPHLRFGTVSIRDLVLKAYQYSPVFLSELIWREFFMHILYFSPESRHQCYRKEYEFIQWRNDEHEFEQWKNGQTGIPLVDAGMIELKQTGYMHNRVRMVAASFLCKHLLIDWRWGEAYFASQLLDYEMSSNVGNWQWVAGTGCDAAPYFRVFNPLIQQKKFDKEMQYIKRWINENREVIYSPVIVDLKKARDRALLAYKRALKGE